MFLLYHYIAIEYLQITQLFPILLQLSFFTLLKPLVSPPIDLNYS